jgi:hypothetical protein
MNIIFIAILKSDLFLPSLLSISISTKYFSYYWLALSKWKRLYSCVGHQIQFWLELKSIDVRARYLVVIHFHGNEKF